MLKKTLVAAAAFLAIAVGASQAEAHSYSGNGYGHGTSHGQGYGHGHGYGYKKWGHYGRHSWRHSYHRPHCFARPHPVTIQVWDPYRYRLVFRTVFRDHRVCR